MTRTIRITVRLLESLGACERRLQAFRKRYPRGVVFTRKTLGNHARSEAGRYDLEWLESRLNAGHTYIWLNDPDRKWKLDSMFSAMKQRLEKRV